MEEGLNVRAWLEMIYLEDDVALIICPHECGEVEVEPRRAHIDWIARQPRLTFLGETNKAVPGSEK